MRSLRPSPSILIALIALFAALGGSAYAVSQLPKNSVGTKQLKDGAVTQSKIAGATQKALRGQQGPTGQTGPTGTQGASGSKGDPGRSALESLRSGERISGSYAVQGQGTILWTGITFPVPAPVPVDSKHVVIAGNDIVDGHGCTGSAVAPVSAPGFVCIYTNLVENATAGSGLGARYDNGGEVATGDGSRFGFIVQARGGAGLMTVNGVWAYTAP